jgi:hypothetical protein
MEKTAALSSPVWLRAACDQEGFSCALRWVNKGMT